MTLRLHTMATTTTLTEVRLGQKSKDGFNHRARIANNDRVCRNMEEIARNSDSSAHSSHQSSQSFSCFMTSAEETRRFWKTPIKFFHVAARELSVLLILIETLILLGGYLMILGVHHSIRYGLSKLRQKTHADDVSNVDVRNQYQHARPLVPRRVPRGRMAGG